jgi:hypothetical protein
MVALSTIEAEYVAVRHAEHNGVYSRQLLQVVHRRKQGATTVCEDNEEAVKFANIPMASDRTIHIDIKHYYIRKLMDARTFAVLSVGTTYIMEDSLTKANDDLHALHGRVAKWILVSLP